uniref:Uncharacterized protein n=1 Tax=Arundo donax TaxID=35708 RepID=A0A0A9FRV0_ARUDO
MAGSQRQSPSNGQNDQYFLAAIVKTFCSAGREVRDHPPNPSGVERCASAALC